MNSDELITIGRIVAPHGVRGDLRILPDTDRPSIYKKLESIRLGGRTYGLFSARPHKNVYIVHLEGVDDRNTAETLVNQIVQVPLSALPERPEGSIYYFELVGMTVVTEEGDNVGTIKEVLKTGANDVYVVKQADGKELCIPAIPTCILSIDEENKVMTVKLLEWV